MYHANVAVLSGVDGALGGAAAAARRRRRLGAGAGMVARSRRTTSLNATAAWPRAPARTRAGRRAGTRATGAADRRPHPFRSSGPRQRRRRRRRRRDGDASAPPSAADGDDESDDSSDGDTWLKRRSNRRRSTAPATLFIQMEHRKRTLKDLLDERRDEARRSTRRCRGTCSARSARPQPHPHAGDHPPRPEARKHLHRLLREHQIGRLWPGHLPRRSRRPHRQRRRRGARPAAAAPEAAAAAGSTTGGRLILNSMTEVGTLLYMDRPRSRGGTPSRSISTRSASSLRDARASPRNGASRRCLN